RQTICSRDWRSDVCSSDLGGKPPIAVCCTVLSEARASLTVTTPGAKVCSEPRFATSTATMNVCAQVGVGGSKTTIPATRFAWLGSEEGSGGYYDRERHYEV